MLGTAFTVTVADAAGPTHPWAFTSATLKVVVALTVIVSELPIAPEMTPPAALYQRKLSPAVDPVAKAA
jgi:hypothetical protein